MYKRYSKTVPDPHVNSHVMEYMFAAPENGCIATVAICFVHESCTKIASGDLRMNTGFSSRK